MDRKRELEVMKKNDEANKRHVEEWKANTMLAVFVDVYDRCAVKKIRVNDNLEDFYRLLNCDYVDMVTRWIAGMEYVIICDDEALLKGDVRPSAINGRDVMLYGNLLVVADGGAGEIRGLTDFEAVHVMQNRVWIGIEGKDNKVGFWQVLTNVTDTKEG